MHLTRVAVTVAALLAALAATVCAAPAPKAGMAIRTLAPTGEFNWRGSPRHLLTVTIWYPAQPAAEEVESFRPAKSPMWSAEVAPGQWSTLPAIASSSGFRCPAGAVDRYASFSSHAMTPPNPLALA
jgi:hypothetical protein